MNSLRLNMYMKSFNQIQFEFVVSWISMQTRYVCSINSSVLAWAAGRADSWQLCQPIRVMCQPMTGCSWDHATSWTTESDIFKEVCAMAGGAVWLWSAARLIQYTTSWCQIYPAKTDHIVWAVCWNGNRASSDWASQEEAEPGPARGHKCRIASFMCAMVYSQDRWTLAQTQ